MASSSRPRIPARSPPRSAGSSARRRSAPAFAPRSPRRWHRSPHPRWCARGKGCSTMYSPRDARSVVDDGPDPLAVLRCPRCGGALDLAAHAVACAACPALYPRDGAIRFVDRAAYAESFGLQWKAFPRVQLDGEQLADSERRLRRETGLEPADLRGRLVLEAGCGMGPFFHLVLPGGAGLAVGGGLSPPLDAPPQNLRARAKRPLLQGGIFPPPPAPRGVGLVGLV